MEMEGQTLEDQMAMKHRKDPRLEKYRKILEQRKSEMVCECISLCDSLCTNSTTDLTEEGKKSKMC